MMKPQISDGGQGRGRTADLPLFRRTLVPTELPAPVQPSCQTRPNQVAPTGEINIMLTSTGGASAVLTGFEPATSALTGRRELQASPQDHAVCCSIVSRSRLRCCASVRPCTCEAGHPIPQTHHRAWLAGASLRSATAAYRMAGRSGVGGPDRTCARAGHARRCVVVGRHPPPPVPPSSHLAIYPPRLRSLIHTPIARLSYSDPFRSPPVAYPAGVPLELSVPEP